MFEYLLLRLGEGALESQRLLMPRGSSVWNLVRSHASTISPRCSIAWASASNRSPRPTSACTRSRVSPSERGVDPGEFLHDLPERADADGFAPRAEAAVHEVLDMMACKAAIKAGDRLNDLEIADLLKLREHVERSSNCPHGVPRVSG